MALGVQFGVGLVLFTLGGVWLDGVTGMDPLFTIVGFLLGFTGATASLYFQVYGRERDKEEKDG